MRFMLQSLESKRVQKARGSEGRLLGLLENGPVSIDELASLEGVCQDEAMASVGRLVAAGKVRLVVAQYPWGVEFSLERVYSWNQGR